jgi:hypothetical protein
MTRQEITVLLREARQGSPDALGELYARYGGRLLAFIRMKMGRDLRARVESRDILQATLLFTLAVLSDCGLRQWVEDQQWGRPALHLLPLVPVYAALGLGLEKSG